MKVKNHTFLTDENLAFIQRLASAENVDCVGIKNVQKNHVIFYKNGVNIEMIHESLQRVDNWIGGLIVYKIVGVGEQIQMPTNEYRNSRIIQK